MEYFLLEAVQTLRHSSAVADSRAQKIEDEMIEAGLIPPPQPPQIKAKKDAQRDSVGSSAASDEEEEGLRARLEAIGMHVGANITERCAIHIILQSRTHTDVLRLCHGRAGFTDTLDIVKFVCKELWSTCWDKQVDNLRTNHRVRFPARKIPLPAILEMFREYMSYKITLLNPSRGSPLGRAEPMQQGVRDLYVKCQRNQSMLTRKKKQYVAMSGGMIRGALMRLGLHGTVTPEINLSTQDIILYVRPLAYWCPVLRVLL